MQPLTPAWAAEKTTAATGELQAAVRIDYSQTLAELKERAIKAELFQGGKPLGSAFLTEPGEAEMPGYTAQVSLRDRQGGEHNGTAAPGALDLTVSGLPQGNYILRLTGEGYAQRDVPFNIDKYSKYIEVGTGDGTFALGDFDKNGRVDAKDRDTALYLFSARRVELLPVDPTEDPSLVTGKAQSTSQPTSVLQFIGFNTAEGRLFSSAALRAAFSRGIDRETLVHAQLVQLALAAQFPVSPLSPLYPDSLETAYSEEAVLEALKEAGQDTGEERELTLLVSAGDAFRAASARFIADHLSLLDWKIRVTALPWEEYLAALEAGDLSGVARRLFNVFEEILPQRKREQVEELKQTLLDNGALGACMTGTGPTVFGLFESGEIAQQAYEAVKRLPVEAFLTYTIPSNI